MTSDPTYPSAAELATERRATERANRCIASNRAMFNAISQCRTRLLQIEPEICTAKFDTFEDIMAALGEMLPDLSEARQDEIRAAMLEKEREMPS